MKISTIKKREDFLLMNKKSSSVITKGLVLQKFKNNKYLYNDNEVRLGITVTKKVGNAVIRNRVKRRFRALAREYLPLFAKAGYDYVLIGKHYSIDRPFERLIADLKYSLSKNATIKD